jgi:2,4-dienoyl-CoA reductase (NADPH2)
MTAASLYEKLLEPGHIGPVKTRNRIIKPGAAMLYSDVNDTRMNGRVLAFYEALARGGVGLIIVESPIVDYPIGGRWRRRYRLDDDKFISGMSELTKVIHQHGCPTFMQMNHDGPWQTMNWDPPGTPPLNTGDPIAASAVSIKAMNDFHNQVPRVLTIPEIEEIIDKFAGAAVRGQKAGFDGVDINSSSSHLLHNFLSPFWNRREDAYGGSLENRTKMLRTIIQEIKKRLGKDFPVCVTINGIEDGRIAGVGDLLISSEISVKTAKLLAEAGADAIQVRGQWLGYHVAGFFPEGLFFPESPFPLDTFPKNYDASHHGAGAYIPLAAAMKQAVQIPLIAVGRIDPDMGEKALREGKVDFIALNRRLFADPELPNKLAAGRLDDIAPCTACHTCLDSSVVKRCRINAAIGTDVPYSIQPAAKKKKVLVVGGGPAGMEAARVAALRGHEVTLYEKSGKLGGIVPLAALVKGLEIEDLPALLRYFKTQLNKLGVNVIRGKEMNAELISSLKPDAVILATGGKTAMPDIKGINHKNVVSSTDLHRRLKLFLRFMEPSTLRWLTQFWMPVGKRVVIIGGGKHGCELAEFLVKRGRQVTIVDKAAMMGEGMFFHLRCALFRWFEIKGVTLISGVKEYVEITDKGLTIINAKGEKQTLEADSIVPALPLTPEIGLMKDLKGRVPEIYAVGDCREPHQIVDAIADGSRAGRAT